MKYRMRKSIALSNVPQIEHTTNLWNSEGSIIELKNFFSNIIMKVKALLIQINTVSIFLIFKLLTSLKHFFSLSSISDFCHT